VHGVLIAAIHPDNTPHGYNWTFAFPMLMFIIVAGALYLRFRSPHRVPGHVALTSSRWAGGSSAVAAQPAAAEHTAPAADGAESAADGAESAADGAESAAEETEGTQGAEGSE